MANDELQTFDELHAWLTGPCALVAEAPHGGSWRTYFAGAVVWHPARATRALKVLLDDEGRPFRVQLCASSDNNNSVLLQPPFTRAALHAAVEEERRRLAARAAAG